MFLLYILIHIHVPKFYTIHFIRLSNLYKPADFSKPFKNVTSIHGLNYHVCIQLKPSQDITSVLYAEWTTLYIIIYVG